MVWLHWSTKFNFFFVPRGKISNHDSTFNAEFKYVSSFSLSPTVFFVTAKLYVKKEWKNVYIIHWKTKFNFFCPTLKKSNPDSTFNAEFKYKYVSSFSPSPTVFFVRAKLNVHYWSATLSRMPSAMNRRLSHSLPASEHIQLVIW
jgi:hypothetical protein